MQNFFINVQFKLICIQFKNAAPSKSGLKRRTINHCTSPKRSNDRTFLSNKKKSVFHKFDKMQNNF